MSNSSEHPIATYLVKHGIGFQPTKSGLGLNIDIPSQVENPQELSALISDSQPGWDLVPFYKKIIVNNEMKDSDVVERFLIGKRKDFTTPEDKAHETCINVFKRGENPSSSS